MVFHGEAVQQYLQQYICAGEGHCVVPSLECCAALLMYVQSDLSSTI